MVKPLKLLLLLSTVLATFGGTAAHAGDTAKSARPVAVVEVSKIYKRRCKRCHGATGRGDGPAASKLKPRPTDWRKLGPISDTALFEIIWEGGKAVGKSKRMPGHKKKLTRLEGQALVKLVRDLAKATD